MFVCYNVYFVLNIDATPGIFSSSEFLPTVILYDSVGANHRKRKTDVRRFSLVLISWELVHSDIILGKLISDLQL